MTYDVGVIGTGDPTDENRYAMAYRHAQGYQRLDNCSLVACADLVSDHARSFADTFDIPPSGVFEDYERMLTAYEIDVLSICTPPSSHAQIVIDCAETGGVSAIHCEKPMARTWSECREMAEVCQRHDVQLTFNHQRRFSRPYQGAKELLDEGRIGDLQRLEMGGQDLYDYGTHLFDLCGYLTDHAPVEWVLAQVDRRNPSKLYGLYQETEALARWRYEGGIDGFASTGECGFLDCHLRIVGTDGIIEVGSDGGPPLRIRTNDSGWQHVDTGRDGIWRAGAHPVDRVLGKMPAVPDAFLGKPTYVERAIEEVVSAIDENRRPVIGADYALRSTEVIFACWESARRGGRVDLPLEIGDNPLEAMVESEGVAHKPENEVVN